jgi:hypothetical protein
MELGNEFLHSLRFKTQIHEWFHHVSDLNGATAPRPKGWCGEWWKKLLEVTILRSAHLVLRFSVLTVLDSNDIDVCLDHKFCAVLGWLLCWLLPALSRCSLSPSIPPRHSKEPSLCCLLVFAETELTSTATGRLAVKCLFLRSKVEKATLVKEKLRRQLKPLRTLI